MSDQASSPLRRANLPRGALLRLAGEADEQQADWPTDQRRPSPDSTSSSHAVIYRCDALIQKDLSGPLCPHHWQTDILTASTTRTPPCSCSRVHPSNPSCWPVMPPRGPKSQLVGQMPPKAGKSRQPVRSRQGVSKGVRQQLPELVVAEDVRTSLTRRLLTA